jgi:hypothetical protein
MRTTDSSFVGQSFGPYHVDPASTLTLIQHESRRPRLNPDKLGPATGWRLTQAGYYGTHVTCHSRGQGRSRMWNGCRVEMRVGASDIET